MWPLATLVSLALAHWSEGKALLPAVRSRKEAILQSKIARRLTHMSSAFDGSLPTANDWYR